MCPLIIASHHKISRAASRLVRSSCIRARVFVCPCLMHARIKHDMHKLSAIISALVRIKPTATSLPHAMPWHSIPFHLREQRAPRVHVIFVFCDFLYNRGWLARLLTHNHIHMFVFCCCVLCVGEKLLFIPRYRIICGVFAEFIYIYCIWRCECARMARRHTERVNTARGPGRARPVAWPGCRDVNVFAPFVIPPCVERAHNIHL